MRAFAVLPVILNHARIPYFSGGFIGVDIFFVISGFLISKIIYTDVSAGQFSLWTFYERRVRRIFPALLVVIAFSFVAAHSLMLPDSYENYSQSVIATLLFSNNILLAITSGYWDLESAFKPLLHTWSLGVEEQFYIFYPFIVMFSARFSKRWLIWTLIAGALVSFAMSVSLTARYPDASFYLLHTRAWELLMGAVLGTVGVSAVPKPYYNIASAAGLSVIIACIVGIHEGVAYPGFMALLPCIGTILVLAFAVPGTLAYRLLSIRIFVGVGPISYSAYLWHQPVFAFARIASVREPNLSIMALLTAVTMAAAYLSWRFVEKPFRSKSVFARNQIFSYASLGSAALIGSALTVYLLGGLPERAPGIGLGHGRYIAYNERVFDYKKDTFSKSDKVHVLVGGNSTGRDLVNVMLESGRFKRYEIVYRDDLTPCGPEPLDSIRNRLLAQADALVFAANWRYEDDCAHAAFSPKSFKKPLVLVGPKHFGYNLNAYIDIPPTSRAAVRAVLLDDTPKSNAKFKAAFPAGHYVDLLRATRLRFAGMPVFDDSGRILSADRVHLTQAGAVFFSHFVFDDPAWQPIFELSSTN